MTLRCIPYLMLDGTAKEAIDFYEKALGGKLLFCQTFGEMPENPEFPLPAEAKDRVSHATIKVGETDIMFSDTFPGQPYQSGSLVTICLSTDDKEQAQQFYEALQEGGRVVMPLQETFFSPGYGIVTDKFGVTFQVYTESAH
ncbi:PhnB protein [Paenibacillus phyllosphaerae]|uniref:PhnB protein n=1 Tax=Paenibacillus phyllosphaerae TaxID=274593 RepID=A0A7W5FLC3_9BACL|nr:VOC family protein [Paenibacillus phyllosphaerae]MBB3108869.1 PhnB protein [Paenibacillus phyllosphaerae]